MKGTPETRKNLVSSIYLEPDELEAHVQKLEKKYALAQQMEQRYETYMADDADILLVGYGIVSRVLRSTVDHARAQGLRVGLFSRPERRDSRSQFAPTRRAARGNNGRAPST